MHSAEGSENRWKLGAFGFRIMKRDRWNVINAQTHLSSIVRTERESHSFGSSLQVSSNGISKLRHPAGIRITNRNR